MSLAEVFTVLRVENRTVPLFSLHVDRLFWGMRSAGWKDPPSRDEVARTLREVLKELPGGRLRVRIGFTPQTHTIQHAPVEPAPQWIFRTVRPISFEGPFRRWKVGDWKPYWKAQARAQQEGYDEALLLRGDRVISLARANLLCFVDGVWCTPPGRTGALNGVMRRFVYRMLKAHSVPLTFRDLTLADLRRAEVVAGMNAVRLFLPLAMGGMNLEPLKELWKELEPAYRSTAVRLP